MLQEIWRRSCGPEKLKIKWGGYSFRISIKEEFRVSNWDAKGTWETILKLCLHSKRSRCVIIYLFEVALQGG